MTRRPTLTSRAAVLALVAGALILLLALPLRSWVAQRNEIGALQDSVQQQQQQVAALKTLQSRWSDPAFVAAQARERLHFVQPGQVGYVVLDPGSSAATSTSSGGAAAAAAPGGPWYATLWDSVDQAAAGQSVAAP